MRAAACHGCRLFDDSDARIPDPRVLAAIPVMGVVALFVFLLLRLTPGDPAALLAGDNATPEQLERIRTSLGLNEPLYTQFFTWIGRLLHGVSGVADLQCAGPENDCQRSSRRSRSRSRPSSCPS